MNLLEVTLPAAEYVDRFYHPDKFLPYCKECPGYENRWCCPPLDGSPDFNAYSTVELYLLQVEARSDAWRSAERLELERRLLAREKETGGFAALLTGMCPHCTPSAADAYDISCARREGKPCRHPELTRPSLEALGFDLCATVRELFGIEMEWGQSARRLNLIGAVFIG